MKKKIYLVTGNHQQLIPLNDYFELIESLFKEEFEIIKSTKIVSSSINIVIDECSNENFVNQIMNKNNETKIIYYLTEFFTNSKTFKIKSFNYFSNNEIKLLLTVLLIKVFKINNSIKSFYSLNNFRFF